jgi:phospholipase C
MSKCTKWIDGKVIDCKNWSVDQGKIVEWIVRAVCVTGSWIGNLVCLIRDTIHCMTITVSGRKKRIKKGKPRIKHVFVLMLENRSFDHMLGFSNISGTDAVTGEPTAIDGLDPSVHSNMDPETGKPVAVSTPADLTLKDIDVDPGHEFLDTLTQLCGKGKNGQPPVFPDPGTGKYPPVNNSGFIMNYADAGSDTPQRIMKCFTEEQLPVMHTLAREFAVCDAWFSSMPGPTFPNRFFLMAGTSGGLDDSPTEADIAAATALNGFLFENGTIFDALDDRCIGWEIYEGDEFPVVFTLSGMNLKAMRGKFTDFDRFAESLNKRNYNKQFIFIEPKYGKHEFSITGPGDFSCGNSMHPLDDVTRGERLLKKTYEVIRNSPHWENSVLLVTFDEHGGFYDHVPPPEAVPPGDHVSETYNHHGFAFDRLGVRVPTLVISPLIKKGTIDHTVYDHTSLLATLQRLWGLRNLTERDKAANDFLHLFTLDTPRKDAPETLPEPPESGLDCGEEGNGDTLEGLNVSKKEFLDAIKTGEFRGRPVEDIKISRSQTGFNFSALMKVLQNARPHERRKWTENLGKLKTGVDAALFQIESRLKIKQNRNR